jgi:hypothetical protein
MILTKERPIFIKVSLSPKASRTSSSILQNQKNVFQAPTNAKKKESLDK